MIAAALASLVVSPLVFLGSALLYVDQEARLRSRGDRQKE
jgi:thiol:disulfide interchange protein